VSEQALVHGVIPVRLFLHSLVGRHPCFIIKHVLLLAIYQREDPILVYRTIRENPPGVGTQWSSARLLGGVPPNIFALIHPAALPPVGVPILRSGRALLLRPLVPLLTQANAHFSDVAREFTHPSPVVSSGVLPGLSSSEQLFKYC